jgi:hypothetical protein
VTAEKDSATSPSEVKPLEGEVRPHLQDTQVQPPPLLQAWQLMTVALALAASVWMTACLVYTPRVGASDVREALGYVNAVAHFNSLPAHRITNFEPHSPLPSAGVEVGDLILDPLRGTLLPGERVRLQIRHDRALRSIDIRSTHAQQLSGLVSNVLNLCLDALMLILGMTIAFRRRHDVAALAIACALLLGVLAFAPLVFPVGSLGRLQFLFGSASGEFVFAALAYSALTFEGGYRSRARLYIGRILIGFCAVWGIWIIIMLVPYSLGRIWVSPDAVFVPVASAVDIVALALCVLAFTDAWFHIEGEPRQRLRWLLLAFAIALMGFSLATVSLLGVFGRTPSAGALVGVALTVLYAVAVITLTYAVLRHRVIDVGFVINRTLVFAVFTGLLLVLFGIVEWLVEHLVHFKQRESSVLLDGVIAVAIYLTFHRVRHGIERLVERVFFRASHARQTALQHFLETAPNFSEPDSLADALLKAVDAYAGSRGSGIYRRDKSGRFLLEKSTLGQLPRELPVDDKVIIELKASHEPYRFGRLGVALAALTLPVVRRSELVGFLAVAEKIDRTLYRPDEIESLVRVVHQVSSDLYALQLERLQQRSRDLEQQNEALREELRSFARSSVSLEKFRDMS